ncbi:hypothetical protein Arub01_27700 [Actinomadura rubrobrunea]|uniref:Uncharacterized protein n=1 Tax=Actinomadura rubrobrunea TaxID=115335 RepID=A0A9W6PWM7_9ACTN|nr:hypothetical protein Arub01_27700 [Actinomadura rubrobrunea]
MVQWSRTTPAPGGTDGRPAALPRRGEAARLDSGPSAYRQFRKGLDTAPNLGVAPFHGRRRDTETRLVAVATCCFAEDAPGALRVETYAAPASVRFSLAVFSEGHQSSRGAP